MGIVYFAVLWMSQGISSGFFNPFIPLYTYMMSRGTTEDVLYNLIAQVFGAISSILLFKPLKTYLD
jgi:glycerol uptake facilitator-like aquaporin